MLTADAQPHQAQSRILCLNRTLWLSPWSLHISASPQDSDGDRGTVADMNAAKLGGEYSC